MVFDAAGAINSSAMPHFGQSPGLVGDDFGMHRARVFASKHHRCTALLSMLMHVLTVLVAMIVVGMLGVVLLHRPVSFRVCGCNAPRISCSIAAPEKHYRYERTFTRGACGASVSGTVGTRARRRGHVAARPPWRRSPGCRAGFDTSRRKRNPFPPRASDLPRSSRTFTLVYMPPIVM